MVRMFVWGLKDWWIVSVERTCWAYGLGYRRNHASVTIGHGYLPNVSPSKLKKKRGGFWSGALEGGLVFVR
jgi:hypothetical protein